MDDIVIDTNVFMHAHNPNEKRSTNAKKLLLKIIDNDILLCVDSGFNLIEAKNSSLICHEYIKHLRHGSIGLAVVVKLASDKRIKELTSSTERKITKKVNQLLRNKSDKIFLKVAHNSNNKVLVSHDYQDFSKTKRKTIKKDLDISIIESDDAIPIID